MVKVEKKSCFLVRTLVKSNKNLKPKSDLQAWIEFEQRQKSKSTKV